MSPPNVNAQPFAKIGYNATVGLIQNDYVCGGLKPDFSLNDPNMILGYTLDYLNAQKGVSTNVEATARSIMTHDIFTNNYPQGYIGGGCSVTDLSTYTYSYSTLDKREYLFGTATPAYPADAQANCVLAPVGVMVYQAGGTVFALEAPSNNCVSASPSHIAGMNYWSMVMNYLWLKGDHTTATQMFLVAIDNWVNSPAQGPSGTLQGYFSDSFDSGTWPGTAGNCKSVRTYAYFLESARATGLWQYNSTVTSIVQKVLQSMWANQNANGSIGVSLNCNNSGGRVRDSGESDGLVLLAGGDPRVPSWFNSGSGQSEQMAATHPVLGSSSSNERGYASQRGGSLALVPSQVPQSPATIDLTPTVAADAASVSLLSLRLQPWYRCSQGH